MHHSRTSLLAIVLACLFVTGLGFTAPRAEASGPPPVVIMETSMGRIIVMLTPKDTPKTVENFLRYVDAGFYDNTIFHRVVKMEEKRKNTVQTHSTINIVQGGGFEYPLRMKRPLYSPIPNEDFRALSNKKGTIAMARTNNPDSATCQFFFNVEDNRMLDPLVVKQSWAADPDEIRSKHGYCVFGKVIRGMDVVEKMLDVETSRVGQHQNVPIKPIVLKRAYRNK